MNNIHHLSKSLLLLPAVILFIAVESHAQLNVTGEFRPRTEYRSGYKILSSSSDDPAFFTSQRSRLNLRYQGSQYIFKLSGQDIRTWGESEQLGDTPNVNMHELWAEIGLSETTALKLGRQELIYDDQRLLGSVNWAQQARSHDALLMKYRNLPAAWTIDLGGAYNQESQQLLGNTYTLSNYKVLAYVWAEKRIGSLEASALGLTDGFEIPSGSVNYRYTYGLQLNYPVDALSLQGSFYVQRGDDAIRSNISAYMTTIKGTYKLNPIVLSAGFDYLSGGNADDENPQRHAFHTLYATNHKFYGSMDYFNDIPRDTRGGGLQDLYAKIGYVMSDQIAADLGYHYFALAGNISDPADSERRLKRGLASELDLSFSYFFSDEITFRLGYSALFENHSLERLQNRPAGGLQHWGWTMLVLSPQIIN